MAPGGEDLVFTRTVLTSLIPYDRLSGCDLIHLKLLCEIWQTFEVRKNLVMSCGYYPEARVELICDHDLYWQLQEFIITYSLRVVVLPSVV